MKYLTYALTSLLALLFAAPESAAIILYGKDNDANQTDPANGVPWANVARMTNSSGTAVTTGSAVYLGNRYMLTANHVGPNNNVGYVTFDGVQTVAVEAGSYQQVANDLDLKIFRLSEDPGLPAMMLYEGTGNDDLSRSTVQVGWGLGRDPTVEPHTNTVPWGSSSTVTKRWGTNTTLAAPTVLAYTDAASNSYSYEGLETILLNTAGDDEAAMTRFDSGGALFQFIDGDWRLSGLATLVDGAGDSVFGNAGPSPIGMGESNYFVRLTTYSDDINALIPEPSTWAILAGLGALGLAVIARKIKKRAA